MEAQKWRFCRQRNNCVRECRLLRFFRNKRQNCKSFCRVPPRNAFRNSPLAVVAKAPVTAACTTLTVIAEDINAKTRKQLCRSVWCNTHEQRQLQAGRNFGQVCSKGKQLLTCSKIGKAGRNFGQPTQKPEYKCLNSEQTKKLAEFRPALRKMKIIMPIHQETKKMAEISAKRVKNCIYT